MFTYESYRNQIQCPLLGLWLVYSRNGLSRSYRYEVYLPERAGSTSITYRSTASMKLMKLKSKFDMAAAKFHLHLDSCSWSVTVWCIIVSIHVQNHCSGPNFIFPIQRHLFARLSENIIFAVQLFHLSVIKDMFISKTQFVNKVLRHIVRTPKKTHFSITVFYLQSNDEVDRFSKTIFACLKHWSAEHKTHIFV